MPHNVPASVQVQHLSKAYGPVEAVRDVSFDVRPGEIFGLLGRNGAGKTTTLECILGLRQPDAGSILIAGLDVRHEPDQAKAAVGAQLQDATLQEKLTPRQALAFFSSFYPRAAPIGEVLERFGLTAKADAPFESLSGGQRQRLFLALAIVHEPAVVVLDEPTVGLDPHVRRELHALIRERRAAGATVLLSTHYLEEAEHLCDRVGILHDGRLVATATPAALIAGARARPVLAARCERDVGEPALATLPGVVGVRGRGREWQLECRDVNLAVVALAQHLAGSGNTLVELQVRRPTLEDAFIELTGTAWPQEGGL